MDFANFKMEGIYPLDHTNIRSVANLHQQEIQQIIPILLHQQQIQHQQQQQQHLHQQQRPQQQIQQQQQQHLIHQQQYQQQLQQYQQQLQHHQQQLQQLQLPQLTQPIRQPQRELVDLITCKLCRGYLIDATTIDHCMHSFCKTCILKSFKIKKECPTCNYKITEKRECNRLKIDQTLQSIVYKLVPNLYEKEMQLRKKFYKENSTDKNRYKNEMFGDIPPTKLLKGDDIVSVTVEYFIKSEKLCKTYIRCRADLSIKTFKKFVKNKFDTTNDVKVYFMGTLISLDTLTLKDVAAATVNWEEKKLTACVLLPESFN